MEHDMILTASSLDFHRQQQEKRSIHIGTLRPDIVMYGESHPCSEEIHHVTSYDIASHPDLVIVMGTSLSVEGICSLVKDVSRKSISTGSVARLFPDSFLTPHNIHPDLFDKSIVILINCTEPPHRMKRFIDYWVVGKTDDWSEICQRHWDPAYPENDTNLSEMCVPRSDVSDKSTPECVKELPHNAATISAGSIMTSNGKYLCAY
jgi:NAD-dependent SIR2 family protein deacetylase